MAETILIPTDPDLAALVAKQAAELTADEVIIAKALASIAADEARLTALEKGTPLPPPIIVPPPPPPPPGTTTAHIVQFASGQSNSSLLTAILDGSIDVLELGPGITNDISLWFNVDRTRPLLICPANPALSVARANAWIGGKATWAAWKATQPPRTAAGAQVVIHSTGPHGDGVFYPGWNGKTSHVTVDSVGGGIAFTNYTLSQTGLCSTAWVLDFEVSGIVVRGTTAPSTNGQTPWCTYASSDGNSAHNGKDVRFNDWEIHLEDDPAGKVNGHQVYHAPGYMVDGYTNLRTVITALASAKPHWGFVLEYDAKNVLVADGTIANCQNPFDSRGPAGIVRGMKSTGGGSITIQPPMQDGGGNSWT